MDLIRGIAHFRFEFAGFKVPVSGGEQQPYIEGLDVVLAEILQLDGNRTGEFPLQKSFVQWKLQRLNPLVKTGETGVILPGEWDRFSIQANLILFGKSDEGSHEKIDGVGGNRPGGGEIPGQPVTVRGEAGCCLLHLKPAERKTECHVIVPVA